MKVTAVYSVHLHKLPDFTAMKKNFLLFKPYSDLILILILILIFNTPTKILILTITVHELVLT